MKNGKRELLVGAVGIVRGSVRNGGKAMVAVCDELEPEFERTGFLDKAPFEVVSIVLRYGTKWGEPDLGKINKRHSELEVGIELPMSEVRMMDEQSLVCVAKKATLEVLLEVARKYELNGDMWQQEK